MRIALIGANGQLGTDLQRRLGTTAVGLDLPDCDVRHEDQLAERLAEVRPDVVINCAALTNVDACEDQTEAAFAVNAIGALAVARQTARLEAAVVYISTDYVFGDSGPRTEPWTEEDSPGPLNVYGASKLAGEWLTRAYNRRSFVVRTCGLYGRAGALGKGGNFVEGMLRAARENRPVRVVSDQRVAPTSTRELADRLAQLIESDAYGLYRVAALDSCTWYEFAEEIFRHEGLPVDLAPTSSHEYGARARRPTLSALASGRIAWAGVSPCRPWRVMLHEYLESRGSS